jgi:hypothetical protein
MSCRCFDNLANPDELRFRLETAVPGNFVGRSSAGIGEWNPDLLVLWFGR